jgi:phosphate transport system protein
MISAHTDRAFEAELRLLRERLQRMATRADEMLADAVRALVQGDEELARQTAHRDRAVNQDEVDIDEQCLAMLARWQPMASDLRLIFAAAKLASNLEQISDLAVNICERAEELASGGFRGPFTFIPHMSEVGREMLRDAMTAFLTANTDLAQEVLTRDDEIDDLHHQVVSTQTERIRAGDIDVRQGIAVQNVARFLENVADHATAIAEHAIFMVHALDVRHAGKRDR